jgi:colanic acid biosynthesis glycosyl transferase WcaI
VFWILSEVFYPEETGTGYYMSKIAEYLAQRRPVSVLCSQPAYSRLGVVAPRIESHCNVKIFRCPCIAPQGRSMFARMIRMASITLSMFCVALLHIRPGDSIMAVTNPPSVPMLAAILSFILRVPYSLTVHDVYPDIVAACGMTSRDATSYKVLQRISKLVLRRAESVICIGRDMADHLARARGTGSSEGIKVIPLWADCDQVQPSPRDSNQLIAELSLKNKLVVLYAGNMGYPHDIETLAAAIKIMELDPSMHFVFIGSGPKQKLLDEMVAHGSRNITVLPPRLRSEQNEFLNACDVAILSLVLGMEGLAVPSRTYNLMAAGKPIIALVSEHSEVARVIREEEIGWVVGPGQVEATVRALQAAGQNRSRLATMGERARRTAESKYRTETILSQFEAALPVQLKVAAGNEVLCQPPNRL